MHAADEYCSAAHVSHMRCCTRVTHTTLYTCHTHNTAVLSNDVTCYGFVVWLLGVNVDVAGRAGTEEFQGSFRGVSGEFMRLMGRGTCGQAANSRAVTAEGCDLHQDEQGASKTRGKRNRTGGKGRETLRACCTIWKE